MRGTQFEQLRNSRRSSTTTTEVFPLIYFTSGRFEPLTPHIEETTTTITEDDVTEALTGSGTEDPLAEEYNTSDVFGTMEEFHLPQVTGPVLVKELVEYNKPSPLSPKHPHVQWPEKCPSYEWMKMIVYIYLVLDLLWIFTTLLLISKFF